MYIIFLYVCVGHANRPLELMWRRKNNEEEGRRTIAHPTSAGVGLMWRRRISEGKGRLTIAHPTPVGGGLM